MIKLTCGISIREFCAMEMPVIMFDKNEDYVVMTVEQVSLTMLVVFKS